MLKKPVTESRQNNYKHSLRPSLYFTFLYDPTHIINIISNIIIITYTFVGSARNVIYSYDKPKSQCRYNIMYAHT